MGAIPSSHPTVSDISCMMTSLGFSWSNEAQIYYSTQGEYMSGKTAEKLYRHFLGNNPYQEKR